VKIFLKVGSEIRIDRVTAISSVSLFFEHGVDVGFVLIFILLKTNSCNK